MWKLLFLVLSIACENIKLTILGTNDVHGRLIPTEVVKEDGSILNIGGLSLLKTYVNILRKNYKNMLWLDAGD